MTTQRMSQAQSKMEILLLNAEADGVKSSDLYAWLRESGLPSEAAIRLKSLVDVTREVGDKVINIGKIILIKIIDFVKAHPNMAIGISIGAAIGALVGMIPFLGSYLAPVATILGVTVGAVAGHRIDKAATGNAHNGEAGLISISQEVIEIAKAFFNLLAEIVNTVLNEQALKGV